MTLVVMNEFVNFNKRGVQLPPGCKDLIDVLGGGGKGKPWGAWELPKSERRIGALADVERYVRKMLESERSALGIVMVDNGEQYE